MGDHLNTALSFPDLLSWPLACQLPASQPREEAECPGPFPFFSGADWVAASGRPVAGVGQSPPNGERRWRLWVMAERVPDLQGEWAGEVRVSVGGALAVGA